MIELEQNKVVEIVLPAAGAVGGPHPFHLHGVSFSQCPSNYHVVSDVLFQHSFWVVRSAGQTTYNYNDAPIRDVVSIGGANDQVTIRFVVCLSRSVFR